MFPESMNRSERRLFALLLVAAAFLYLYDLDATGLWAPDEPRFAAVAEELRRTDHGAESLVVLRLSGEPYTQKPPLYYWMVAALSSFDGRVSEFTARLPSALAGIACIALTVVFGHAISRRPAVGLWSGAVLLTVFRFSHLARRAQLDVILAAFVLIALFALFRLRDAPNRRGFDFYLLHVALALGVLTKGPVALLPIPAFALYLLWQGRLGSFGRMFPWWSFAISLGPALVWVALAVAATPAGYFEAAIVDNVLERFLSGTAHVRPFYYFFVQYPLEFMPWTLLWPAAGMLALRNVRDGEDRVSREATQLLLAFIALCFVFFSFSAGKRGLYLLPTYPAVAMLCGLAIDDVLGRRRPWPALLRYLPATLGISLAAFGAVVWSRGGFALERWPGFQLPVEFGAGLVVAIAACGVAAVAATRLSGARAVRVAPAVVGLFALEWLVFIVALPAFDAEKSPAPIARAAAASSRENAPIGVFDHTAMKGGIAFYSGHRVVDLRSEESLRDFLARGGESIVVKASKLDRVPAVAQFEVRATFRRGSRRVVVIAPTSVGSNRVPRGPALARRSPG